MKTKPVCAECLSEVVDAHETCPVCGFVRPKEGWLADPLTGLILGGRYRLEGRLGAGGMASVLRATRIGALGGHVAVKVLAPRFARTVVARRFEREAQVVARLTNPHIVRIYDFDTFNLPGSDLNLYYIAMELIEGSTLTAVLQAQGRVNFLWGIDILRQISRGLEEAHRQGITHRDLKPSNVMLVTHRGSTHVKLLDFGIAALADREQVNQEKLTVTGFVSGTPDYMAPEQAVGDPSIGPPADIFALGIIAYEMFSGKRPFAGATMESLLARVTKQAPALREAIADAAFPPELFRIVDKMLMREPEKRYRDAGELLDELGRFPTLQTTPDFVPPADLLKRYATASQPAFQALIGTAEAAAMGSQGGVAGAAGIGVVEPTVEAVQTVAARPAARAAATPGGDYSPPSPKKPKSSAWVWIVALLVLGGAGAGITLALTSASDAGPTPIAGGVPGGENSPPPTPPTPTSPSSNGEPFAASAAFVGARPPIDAGLREHRLPLGRDLIAVALPETAPALWRPMPLSLAYELAGKPMVGRSAHVVMRLARGGASVGSITGIGRASDGRVSLDLPPRPIADRYELDVDLELATGERTALKLTYDANTHEVRARP